MGDGDERRSGAGDQNRIQLGVWVTPIAAGQLLAQSSQRLAGFPQRVEVDSERVDPHLECDLLRLRPANDCSI